MPTPYYLIDEKLLVNNLEILKGIKDRTGCKILLAQKAFSCYHFYPLIAKYLDGTTASGLFEARLGFEEMGKETHVFSPAYREEEFEEICRYADHIIFNSAAQLAKYRGQAKAAGISCGIRVNPELSTQDKAIYDPCAPYSRMGVTLANFSEELLYSIEGLHFHTLCEQNADALERTLDEIVNRFGKYFDRIKWINFGGGHHITRADYDIEKLVSLINAFKSKYKLEVYLEPGEAVVLDSGFLVSTVLDIVDNGKKIAILDTSAACHMPDVLEVPYTPRVFGSGADKEYAYILSSCTCLAGDIIGEYAFAKQLKFGDQLIFEDMALYTFVKNNTFNGINLPSIVKLNQQGEFEVINSFGYQDFKSRL
ncbi:MAG: carboxynorspermidine decarboxylase [Clostridia bacterium]|nr:carboxynorspermidine decarboxylase [Clostridia bacterium]